MRRKSTSPARVSPRGKAAPQESPLESSASSESVAPSATRSEGKLPPETKCCFCARDLDPEEPWLGPFEWRGSQLYGHSDCVLWCPEVFGPNDKLENVDKALSRRSIRCVVCKKPGGVIGCFLSKCQRSYHFPCAKEAGCVFVGNYSQVYCPEHRDEGAKQPEQVFQVERILKHKLVRGKKLYLVKWQGYPESECTWEPQESFYSSQVLDEYEESLKSARALAKGTPVQEARSASVDAEEAEQESEQGHEEGQKSDAAADAPAEIETPKPRKGRWGARTPASGAKAAPDAAKSGSPAAPAAPSEQTAAKPDDLAQSTPSGRRKGAAAAAVAVPVAEPQPSADETPPAKRAAVAQKETPPAALQPVSSSRKRGAPSDVANASATSEEESTKRVKQSEAAEATATPTTGSRLTRSKGSAKTESAGPSAAAPETETAPFAAAEAGGGAQPAAASLATAEAEAAPATAASAPPPPAGAGAEVEQGAARAAAEAKEEAEQRPGRRTPRPQSAKPKFAVQRIPLRIKYVGGDEVTSIIEAPPLAEWPAL